MCHRKEIQKLTFRALALLRSESRNCDPTVTQTDVAITLRAKENNV